MEPTSRITNKVDQSGLITLDLETLKPAGEIMSFDLGPFLFEGLILREREFRENLKQHDWNLYRDKWVALTCTADAIIPLWAYMLVTSCLEPVAKKVFCGTREAMQSSLFEAAIDSLDVSSYAGQRVVIKGCSNEAVPLSAYVAITEKLRPHVRSIFFGEPCSTVPIYKAGK